MQLRSTFKVGLYAAVTVSALALTFSLVPVRLLSAQELTLAATTAMPSHNRLNPLPGLTLTGSIPLLRFLSASITVDNVGWTISNIGPPCYSSFCDYSEFVDASITGASASLPLHFLRNRQVRLSISPGLRYNRLRYEKSVQPLSGGPHFTYKDSFAGAIIGANLSVSSSPSARLALNIHGESGVFTADIMDVRRMPDPNARMTITRISLGVTWLFRGR